MVQFAIVTGAGGGLESRFPEKGIVSWGAKSGGKNPFASNILTSASTKGSKVSNFVMFKKLVQIFTTTFSTLLAPMFSLWRCAGVIVVHMMN